MNQHVKDDGDLRKYRTELPNMADDELDPYQYRLYAHYKRVCGANGGTCWEGRAKTADTCKMSEGMVTKTRAWLANNGWIHLERGDNQNDTYNITIIDRWSENMTRYSDRSSCGDDRSHGVTTGRHVVTQRSNSFKNKPIKKNNREATPPPAAPKEPTTTEHPFIAVYREVFRRYPNKAQMVQLAKLIVTPPGLEQWQTACSAWLMAGYKPDNLRGILDWYRDGVPERGNGKLTAITGTSKPVETRTIGGVVQEKIGGVWYNKRNNTPTGAA